MKNKIIGAFLLLIPLLAVYLLIGFSEGFFNAFKILMAIGFMAISLIVVVASFIFGLIFLIK
jgi:hypothetical protein